MGIHLQYLASESMGVRALALKVITDDISILLDPACALGPIPNFPTPHTFEYVTLQQSTRRILDACVDTRLIAISHYHHDHYKPRERNWEYLGSDSTIFQQIFRNKMVFAKHPTDRIGTNQRVRAGEFQQHLTEVNGSFVPSDGRRFLFRKTEIRFSPPLPHGSVGTKLGYVIGICIQDPETCFCFCPDVQGPTVPETVDWILAQDPHVIVLGGPPLYLSPPKFTLEDRDAFYRIIELLAKRVRKIVIDHHLFRHTSGIASFYSLKEKLKKFGCTLCNFAEQNNERGNFLEAWRERLYANFPPNEQFLRWTNSPKKNRENTPPPIPGAIPNVNY
ncbi:MAG: hypothetical protein RBG13Loki_3836 [Promethearchaeota archaeon CR_4]|nr:MAG: hypothetical protein RBG13Loki_3836 [Candidatus Lokiarchaeota archaeon CR_4]